MHIILRSFTFFLVLLTLPGCWLWRGPTEEECEKAHLNNVRLLAEDETLPEEMKRLMIRTIVDPQRQHAMIKSCVEKKTLAQIRCEMGAKSFFELTKCSPPRAEDKPEEKK